MAEKRDGDHVSAEDQIVQARAALAVPSSADVQFAFDGWTHDRGLYRNRQTRQPNARSRARRRDAPVLLWSRTAPLAVGAVLGGRPQPLPLAAGARPIDRSAGGLVATECRKGVPGSKRDDGYRHASDRRQLDRLGVRACYLNRFYPEPRGRKLLLARLPKGQRGRPPITGIDRPPHPGELMEHVPPGYLHRERFRVIGPCRGGGGERKRCRERRSD